MSRPFKTALIAAIVSAVVTTGTGVAATQAFALGTTSRVNSAPQARSWKWCHRVKAGTISFKELCSSGRVIFTWQNAAYMQSGYRSVITGFRQTGPRAGIVDTRGDGYILEGECWWNDPTPPPEDCIHRGVTPRARYATRDGGRHWLPVRAHRRVSVTHGDGTPQYWDFDVALRPCNWKHTEGHEEVEGVGGRFGNYCSPERLWLVDTSP